MRFPEASAARVPGNLRGEIGDAHREMPLWDRGAQRLQGAERPVCRERRNLAFLSGDFPMKSGCGGRWAETSCIWLLYYSGGFGVIF